MSSIKEYLVERQAAKKRNWDAVVVGAGMGGAATAYALTKAGYEVLIIECGDIVDNENVSQGVTADLESPEARLKTGQWPNKIRTEVDGFSSEIWPAMGCGVGGSTLLYAAALQRLEPMDFEEQLLPSGARISWPFSYQDLLPFYEDAENLLGVRGTSDPRNNHETTLQPPPAMCDADQNYFSEFQRAGLNPYRLHVGIDYKEGCGECGGHVCPKSCKRDAYNSFILPAVRTGKLSILTNTNVHHVVVQDQVVSQLVLDDGDSVGGKNFFLAAGALNTPKILLNSKNDLGEVVGDHSGLLGRNLMFHASDFIAVWPTKKCSRVGANKTIALRDFYSEDGNKMGEFQSTGLEAGYGNILYAAKLALAQSRFRKIPLLSQLLRIPAYVISKILGQASIFATIVEDYPYLDNKVTLDETAPSGFKIVYFVKSEFKERVALMSKRVRTSIGKLKSMKINLDLSLNYGHPCGTCKAATLKEAGVIDKNCKVFDTENLYITDASFMPTSGGTNPSLTIAANAIRVVSNITS